MGKKVTLMIARILIVNDSRIERMIPKEKLSEKYMVFEASSGRDAYDLLDKESVDIILLDNVMENETGYDVAKRLRKNSKYDNVPLVLMTSNDNPIDEMNAFESGFNAYFHKSNIEKMSELIESFEKKELREPFQVLIVDDSRIIRAMLSYTFQKEGFTIKTAESGEEALKVLESYQPVFITMDVEMGGITGYETTDRIRNNPKLKDTPIIMITKLDTVDSRIKGFEAGVTEYFTKPFEPIKLIEYIKNVILKLTKKSDKRILVVEDSLSTQHIITYSLNKQGFDTICVSTAEDIWDVYNKGTIDLILIDLNMGMNQNYELINKLQKESKKKGVYIPLIVITSIESPYAIIEAFRNGADDYISRPFTSKELIIRVLTHLSHKREIDENKSGISTVINEEFISYMNHDLRSPITSITSIAELLIKKADKYKIDENALKFINNIQESSSNSLFIIDDVIHYLNLKMGFLEFKYEKVSIEKLLHSVKDTVQNKIKKKNISIEINTNNEIKPIKSDVTQLSSCFLKLIENAILFSPNDSIIEIEVYKGNNEISIEIKDEGIGISKDIEKDIFKPFFSYIPEEKENIFKHPGLGLPIAQEIIKRHKGHIELKQKTDSEGAIFRLIMKENS